VAALPHMRPLKPGRLARFTVCSAGQLLVGCVSKRILKSKAEGRNVLSQDLPQDKPTPGLLTNCRQTINYPANPHENEVFIGDLQD